MKIKIIQGDLKKINEREEFSNSIISDLFNEEIELMGFNSRNEIKNFVKNFIFTKFSGNNKVIKLDKDKIKKIIIDKTKKVYTILEDLDIKVFVFPTYNDFVINNMKGVVGFCTNKNVIILGIYFSEKLSEGIEETIIHELAHAISPYYDMANLSIGEGIVFDGLAENFVEDITGKDSYLGKTINKNKSFEIFKDIKDKLDVIDFNLYSEIFFGKGKYSNWAGYSIGYYLIKDWLFKFNKKDWREILKKNPKEILDSIMKDL